MEKEERIIRERKKIETRLLKQGNINLILDSYQGIFSDFDPRSYSEKAISDDFITEVKRAVRDKEEFEFELRLFIPKEKRNTKDELMIKERLRNHFQKHFKEKEKDIKKIKWKGISWVMIGSVLMIAVTLLRTYTDLTSTKMLLVNFLSVIMEPAAWFSFWEGLGKIFIYSKEKEPEYEAYKKMIHAKISFQDY